LPLPQLLHHQLQLWRFRLVLLALVVLMAQVVLLAQVVQVVLLAQVVQVVLLVQVAVAQVAVMEQVLADIRPLLKSQIA
jgi:hypothetical protein